MTEFALGVGSLFYYVDWTICNDPDVDEFEEGELDGINGSSDILERIARLRVKPVQDNFQSAEFTDQLTLITEAVLTIRNMVMLPDNAYFMSEFMPLKDLLCILLHLPDLDIAVELKHSALDIAEQLTPWLTLTAEDPLYKTLLGQLDSTDRGTILTALRAIGRIAMNHPTETNRLDGVPPSVLQHLMDWLLLNDDELMDACLDFLYQYTAIVSNLDTLLQSTNAEHLVTQLVRLLSHSAKRGTREYVVSEATPRHDNETDNQSNSILPVPSDLLERLLAIEEPERCYQWLRCFFEEDPDSHVTQIAVWQAYNAAFLEPLKKKTRPIINAGEFIRNISNVYQTAGAQIMREGPQGDVPRYILRGIRPRLFPVSLEGRGYSQCQWMPSPDAAVSCGMWHLTAAKMWEHILVDHLKEQPREDNNQFKNREGIFTCTWNGCAKYSQPTKLYLIQFMAHIKTHLTAAEAAHSYGASGANAGAGADGHTSSSRASSSSGGGSGGGKRHNKARVVEPAKTISLTYEETASVRDERQPNAPPQAAGIPLSAVLILRNIARNVGKTEAEEALIKRRVEPRGASPGSKDETAAGIDGDDTNAVVGYKERLFRPVMGRLWEVFTENRVLAKDLTQLFQLLDA